MLADFFDFDKSSLLYFLASPGGFGIDVLGLFALGILILLLSQMVFYVQLKSSKNDSLLLENLLFSKRQIAILMMLFFIGGLGIGYLYEGIFEIWVMLVFSFLVLLSMVDYKILAIPDWMNMALFFCVLIGMFYFSGDFWHILLDGFAISGLFSLVRIFGDMIFNKEVLGEGDIVFGASIGMLLGFYDSLMSVFWGCFIACLCVILLRFFGKKVLKLPMITSISAGLLFCFVESIIND